MNKTIGVVAHVDAGKTTLLEQILFNCKTINQAGRVDKQNTLLDYHTIERQRGITVFSDQATVKYNNSTFYIVDTPGHADFSTEMERAVRILDAAIIILSGVEGIEGHTLTVWHLLQKYHIPTLFFINKLDRVGANFEKVCQDITKTLTKDLCVFTRPIYNEDLSDVNLLLSPQYVDDTLIEFMAERDDTIMEPYVNDRPINTRMLIDTARRLMVEGQLFPCLCGSGLKNMGVNHLFWVLDQLIATRYDASADFSGTVYKIRHDNTNNQQTFIKVLAGTISVKDTITHHSNEAEEKINEIRLYQGNKYISKSKLHAGELGALCGINAAYIGEGLGYYADFNAFSLVPALKSKVKFDENVSIKEIIRIFKILTVEDPAINARWVEDLNELHIQVMGLIQLEILQQVIQERFGIKVDFGIPEVLYKETVCTETYGFGHFEPYKHFAEVKFKISPNPRDAGITFSSACSGDILHTRWQRAIEKNIHDGCQRGILTGSPLTDIHITLLSGKNHVKHTSGGDFRQATFRAIRQGIEKVNNMLLEPYYAFIITVTQKLSGRVMSDIAKMKGTFDPPLTNATTTTIKGKVPVATAMYYPAEVAAFSQGKGMITLTFYGYDVCHNSAEVIQRMGYERDKDPEFTSHSVYCSHGKTFSIPGKDIGKDS